jgi:predicted TIM-barrel fold metal-dependent hydrolase
MTLPRSQLVLPETVIEHPSFSVVDAHTHLGGQWGGDWLNRPIEGLIDMMDEAGVQTIVDLDGGWSEAILEQHLGAFKAKHPERFMHFGGVDWSQWSVHGDGFGDWAAHRLAVQADRGAQGLKIWKPLGLSVVDDGGTRVTVDDPRLDPIWETAGSLGLPIIIHVGDPIAFFDPLDETNERWDELHAHPEWHFPSPPYPPFLDIVEALARVVERHRETTFIGAHVGCYAENLAWVRSLLDRAPNFYVDISARIAELGRQPRTARRFFIDYADRILFGTDGASGVDDYRLHYRFLETSDEGFDYSVDGEPHQGRWRISALDLPPKVLEQVYCTTSLAALGNHGSP